MATIGTDVEQAAHLLRNGELVSIPTETVYGLAGNAFSEPAILKIFNAKNRPFSDPLIVHTHSVAEIEKLAVEIPELARQLFETFSPGPLTILLSRSSLIPDRVTNGSPLVAVRIPDHPLTLQLLRLLDFPLAAPSANLFGALSPTLPTHVNQSLGDKIPYILDGGPCTIGLESTIIQIVNQHSIKVLRQGGVAEESLLAFAKLVEDEKTENQVVPGSMLSHYAPNKPIYILDKTFDPALFPQGKTGFLGFSKTDSRFPTENQILLSPAGDLNEAARNLFASLHQMDAKSEVEVIVAENFPNEGVGKAINDRLRRAAAKRGA